MSTQIALEVMEKRHKQMLYPVCRVRSQTVGGSATIVYSQKRGYGETPDEALTYALTNYHVIENSIKVEDRWDPDIGKKVPTEFRQTIHVEYFTYNNYSRAVGGTSTDAKVCAYNAKADVALLEFKDRENLSPFVAVILPEARIVDIHLFDTVYAVGAALGHPPIVTQGIVNHLDDEIDNHRFMLTTANIIFGNSGGALYYATIEGDYYLVGIPSRVAVAMAGFSADAITHMGYSIVPDTLYQFLRDNCYDFIVGERTLEECEKAREEMKERKKKERLIMEQA